MRTSHQYKWFNEKGRTITKVTISFWDGEHEVLGYARDVYFDGELYVFSEQEKEYEKNHRKH